MQLSCTGTIDFAYKTLTHAQPIDIAVHVAIIVVLFIIVATMLIAITKLLQSLRAARFALVANLSPDAAELGRCTRIAEECTINVDEFESSLVCSRALRTPRVHDVDLLLGPDIIRVLTMNCF
jgi:hypothetical protein